MKYILKSHDDYRLTTTYYTDKSYMWSFQIKDARIFHSQQAANKAIEDISDKWGDELMIVSWDEELKWIKNT